jgi:hypothetical protein
LKSRRGLLTAGLAVVVVGAIATASTLNASAELVPGAPDPSASAPSDPAGSPDATAEPTATASADEPDPDPSGPVASAAEATPPVGVAAPPGGALETPPAVLPWGRPPAKIRTGRAGVSSEVLRSAGLGAAPADTSGAVQPRPRYGPKGRVGNRTFVRSESTSGTVTAAPPSPPSGSGGSGGSAVPTVNYFYNAGSQAAETDGYYATAIIGKPTLATADYHTLAELALQSADGQQIVEVGWNVDRVVNGDDDPHLFVYHWVNHTPSCYNGCGFVQYSTTVTPGATLANGAAKKFGIQYFSGAWWIAYDSEWIGYFPETLWTSQGVPSFNRSGLIQTFGEVAASSATPCSQMGKGLLGINLSAAMLSSVSYLNGPPVSLTVWSSSTYYTPLALSARTFRYGGPGAC